MGNTLYNILIEGRIHEDIQEAIRFITSHGIELDGDSLDYYIGSGAFGDVYKVKGKEKVIKFYPTLSRSESEKYNDLLNKKLTNVVNVFFNRVLKSADVGVVVMEYLVQPPKTPNDYLIKSIFIHTIEDVILGEETEGKGYGYWVRTFLTRYRDSYREDPDVDQILEVYKDDPEFLAIAFCGLSNYIVGYYTEKDNQIILFELASNEQLFRDVMNGIRELHDMGVHHEDIHNGNILYDPKTKKYKLIDPL